MAVEFQASGDAPVLVEQQGRLGLITLNRPKAMNALNHEMVQIVAAALDAWEDDPTTTTVLIRGAGERGLCAGGDIVSIYRDALSGGRGSEAFWRDEYKLNARIHNYPKPIVTLMDGVVLGGGVGISAHASHRVVTERSRIGMPETGIGFVPDVGGLFLLARAPGELGAYAALTGAMVSGADAMVMGLADHFVPAEDLAALVATLSERQATDGVELYEQAPPESALLAQKDWIDAAFKGSNAREILERLAASSVAEAVTTGEGIAAKSPTAVVATLTALRRAAQLETLEDALNQDYRVSVRALRWPDFAEGIRAQLVDKDRNPKWKPETMATVSQGTVEIAFASLGSDELGLESSSLHVGNLKTGKNHGTVAGQ